MPIPQWEGRWTIFRRISYQPEQDAAPPDRDGWRKLPSTEDGVTTGWIVRTGNIHSQTPEDYELDFGPEEEAAARALCAEFNRYEWQGPLDPAFEDRRQRLRELAPDFGSFYFEGPGEARWPVRPGRYLVRDGGVGWHPEAYDELVDDLEGLKTVLAEEERSIYSVIDLDTGDAVPFAREIAVSVGADAL